MVIVGKDSARWLNAPAELRQRRQWVGWRKVIRGDRATKVPYQALRPRSPARTDDPDTFATFEQAMAAATYPDNGFDGIGFVFTAEDPYCGIDFDHCIGPDGELEPFAGGYLDSLGGYQEVSPSGTGIKVIVKAALAPLAAEGLIDPEKSGRKVGKKGKAKSGAVEVYDRLRFFTVTGDTDRPGVAIPERQAEVEALVRDQFPTLAKAAKSRQERPAGPMPASDEELLRKAREAKDGPKFSALYDRGDATDYASGSEADLALCNLLAFWTGGDPDRIDALFRRSARCRDKWLDRSDYRESTIDMALSGREQFYQPGGLGRAKAEDNGAHAEVLPPANKANKANKGGSVGGSNGDLSSHSSHSSQGATLPEHDEPVVIREWPAAPGLDLWHGPAADFTLAVAPHTEADPIGVLASVLATIGSMVGRGPHWNVGATTHYLNLFVCTVGRTSAGRKGTAKDLALWAADQVDPVWASKCVKGGLSSGEGLIWTVRDPIVKRMPVKERGRVVDYQDETVDQGVEDKRLLVVETEFGGTLKVMAREGNTLSSTLRQAWDTGNLGILTKNNPAVATGAHISILAHSTELDVERHLSTTEAGNGFGNRFLWLAVRRSKYLPSGSPIPEDVAAAVIKPLAEAVAYGRGIGWALRRDQAADELWDHLYRTELDVNAPGLLGAILGRAEAQTMRLACLFAILDRTTLVGLAHLRAALELWRYCVRSAGFIFGDQLGDPDAELLLSAIQSSPEGMAQKQITVEVFQKHKSKRDIARILGRLLEGGLIRSETVPTGGRPATVWFSTRVANEANEANEAPGGVEVAGGS